MALLVAAGAPSPGRARYPERRHRPGASSSRKDSACGCSSASRSRRCATWTTRSRAARPTPTCSTWRAPTRPCATPRRSGCRDYLDLYENGDVLPAPRVVVGARRAAVRQVVRVLRRGDRAPHRRRGCRTRPSSSGARGCSTCCSSTRFSSDQSRFSIQPRLARLGHPHADRAALPAAGRRACAPSSSSATPGSCSSIRAGTRRRCQFVRLGFLHILDGADHLLFLVVPRDPVPAHPLAGRRRRPRSPSAHSITLHRVGLQPRARRAVVSAARRHADRHVDRLHGAREHRLRGQKEPPSTAKPQSNSFLRLGGLRGSFRTCAEAPLAGDVRLRPRRTASAFRSRCGQTLQFAGSHLLTSLLSFNVGVELGQLLVLVLLIPALDLLFRYRRLASGWGRSSSRRSSAHTAWHWMDERWELLRQFTFEWPAIDAAFLAGALRWMMLLVVAAAFYWLVLRRPAPTRSLKSERTLKSALAISNSTTASRSSRP